ncbi:MAG: response regulator, partial [Lachnospiraceae bacterium]|nr:response regulator [Lachnospiraceae bacterium]
MNKQSKRRYRILIALLAVLTVAGVVVHFVSLSAFNSTCHTSKGNANTEEVYMDLHFRGGTTSTWIKREIDLTGIIYDGAMYNNSKDDISSWSLRINIKGDCYINQFWNGTVEIHQNADSDNEVVQKLNLADYKEDDIELEYTMDAGDLLIPLHEGDYVIYHPSTQLNEMPLTAGFNVVVGTIFYYADDVDLTDYSIDYYFHREFTQGIGFIVVCVLFMFLLFSVFFYYGAIYIYKKAEKEMELRKEGISCMAEIYALMYIVDINKDTLAPVGVDEEDDAERPVELGANEQLQNLCRIDVVPEYQELMFEFAELSTLPERLKNRNSVVFEYVSGRFGWSRMRFIAMNRDGDKPLEKVLCTIQQINQEKEELDKVMGQVEKAKSESNAKSAFLANMSHEIRTPINTVLGLDTMILRESKDKVVRGYAKDIKIAGNMLLSLINSILDFSKLEAGRMELVPVEYSLKNLVRESISIVKPKIENKNLELIIDVTSKIPDKLYGDDVRLKQIIINILTNAVKYTEEGSVRLGIFGTVKDENIVHLLVSVKDTGIGIKPEDQERMFQRFSRVDESRNHHVEGTGLGMDLVTGLLSLMDSELKVASVYGEGSDFYFEIEQKILDPTPIGDVNWDELGGEDEEGYEASFTAPDANVLVVDDNDMNLTVFCDLIKDTEICIDQASSGMEALKLTQDKHYDIIFMDHMMPQMDGIEAMKRIKAQDNGANKKTPV